MQKEFCKLKEKYPVQFIIVTGDLHQYNGDYNKTLEFLKTLGDVFCLESDNVFIVPGNHDAGNFPAQKAILRDIDDNIENNPDYYLQYLNGDEGEFLKDRFQDYVKFLETFYGKPTAQQLNVDLFTWKDKINILSLNTALVSNGNNTRKQIIDVRALSKKHLRINTSNPTIVIGHHPVEALCESHQSILKKIMAAFPISAYYCGDLHQASRDQIYLPSSGKTIPQIICAKSVPDYSDSYSDIGCFISRKRTNSSRVDLVPVIWSARSKEFIVVTKIGSDRASYYDLQINSTFTAENEQTVNDIAHSSTSAESVWVPDAEFADRKAARFRTYTSAQTLDNFMQKESKKWGLSAAKGVGKTFALQIKRSKYTDENLLCLPIQNRPTRDNEWGAESIEFSESHIKHFKSFKRITDIWKLSFVCYVINQCINYKYYWERRTSRSLEEKIFYPNNLNMRITDLYNRGRISERISIICKSTDYEDLPSVVMGILSNEEYLSANRMVLDYDALSSLRFIIPQFLKEIDKDHIGIFVDKIDQSLHQTTSEPPSECIYCYKQTVTDTCTNSKKGTYYCSTANCKINCCYGCDIFATPNLNQALRLYQSDTWPEYRHINLWQHLQLALVVAVYDLKILFKGSVIIYYTIREEAFTCESTLLGEHQKKILSLTQKLYYTKEEQHQIYLECIHNQADEYLFDPTQKRKPGMEEYAFLGIKKFCHPYVQGAVESVFDSIYRHSFDRARDIQEYGNMLTLYMKEIRDCKDEASRTEKVKKKIEEYAALLAYSPIINDSDNSDDVITSYYVEKHKLLPNHWANQANFRDLILNFNKNMLFYSDLVPICKKINNKRRCPGDCNKCELHPFSMLYRLGLLGRLKYSNSNSADVPQEFLASREITYVRPTDVLNINENTIYLLHPALTKSIEALKGHNIQHFNGFIIGREIQVPNTLIKELLDEHKNLRHDAFKKKRFCLPTND